MPIRDIETGTANETVMAPPSKGKMLIAVAVIGVGLIIGVGMWSQWDIGKLSYLLLERGGEPGGCGPRIEFSSKYGAEGLQIFEVAKVHNGPFPLSYLRWVYRTSDSDLEDRSGTFLQAENGSYNGVSYIDRAEPTSELNEGDQLHRYFSGAYELDIYDFDGQNVGGTWQCRRT